MNINLASQTQLYLGLFERETYPWLWRLSQGIASAIDIGAAHGEYTLFFLKNTLASKIYAFEPSPIIMSHLRGNLGLNPKLGLERLVLSSKLVGRTQSKDIVCLDELTASIKLPCFIKMDVDGSEAEILLGAKLMNALPRVRWLIETHSIELESQCVSLLERAGFRTKIVENAWWRIMLPELRPIAHNRWLVAWKGDRMEPVVGE